MDTTTNKGQIYIIVCTICLLAVACVATNCYLSVFCGKEPGQAFTLLTGGLVGSLTAMLVKTSPTETVKQPPQPIPPPPPSPDQPQSVTVVNPPSEPVPTTETPKT